eukprot:Hpha_TRINITY_DN425_c0_g1::TRINITY_DN425_c0_g1_i1::g.27648::m.27648
MGKGESGFDGLEGWKEPWRPSAGLAVWCVLTTAGMVCLLVVTIEVVHEVQERKDFSSKASDLSKETPCRVTGHGTVEERDAVAVPGDDSCDGEPCAIEYRVWVGVRFNATGGVRDGKCWAHIDDTWEKDQGAVLTFLEDYTVGGDYLCCYAADDPTRVRFCDWSKPACFVCGSRFWAPLTVVVVWLLVAAGRAAYKYCPWVERDNEGYQHTEGDTEYTEQSDREMTMP